MSILGSILDKIFHHSTTTAGATTAAPAQTTAQAQQPTVQAQPTRVATAQPLQAVDVEAVLTKLASSKGGGNWRTSIVDLLKLLDLDSSLTARKQLAQELNVHAGADGTAEQNIALSKAVMQKLAENGGKVPEKLASLIREKAMGIIWTIIIGFIAGVIAKFIMPGKNEPSGFVLTTILGIVGAVIASYLGQALGWYAPGEGAGLIGAVVGAIVVLFVWGMVTKRSV